MYVFKCKWNVFCNPVITMVKLCRTVCFTLTYFFSLSTLLSVFQWDLKLSPDKKKPTEVIAEWLADTETHLITPNPLASSSWLRPRLTVGIVKRLLDLHWPVEMLLSLSDLPLWLTPVMHTLWCAIIIKDTLRTTEWLSEPSHFACRAIIHRHGLPQHLDSLGTQTSALPSVTSFQFCCIKEIAGGWETSCSTPRETVKAWWYPQSVRLPDKTVFFLLYSCPCTPTAAVCNLSNSNVFFGWGESTYRWGIHYLVATCGPIP